MGQMNVQSRAVERRVENWERTKKKYHTGTNRGAGWQKKQRRYEKNVRRFLQEEFENGGYRAMRMAREMARELRELEKQEAQEGVTDQGCPGYSHGSTSYSRSSSSDMPNAGIPYGNYPPVYGNAVNQENKGNSPPSQTPIAAENG